MFFHDHPRFLETSQTSAQRDRLNLRHEAIITANRHILDGARVVDIASHDGRWSCAALRAGAQHVIGIEARKELIDHSNDNLAHYGFSPQTYRFEHGDVFEVLQDGRLQRDDADVVLCLGFLYHTLRYAELFSGIRRLKPRYLVLDTAVYDSTDKVVRLVSESTEKERNAVAALGARGTRMLSGWPSVPAVEMMLSMWGFQVEEYVDWTALISTHPDMSAHVARYATGSRVTARCRRRGFKKSPPPGEPAEGTDD